MAADPLAAAATNWDEPVDNYVDSPSPTAACALAFANTALILGAVHRRARSSSAPAPPTRIDRFTVPAASSLVAPGVPARHARARASPPRSPRSRSSTPWALYGTALGADPAVPRHRHRGDLHLRPVHARHPRAPWTRRRGHRRRGPRSASTSQRHPAQLLQARDRHRRHHQGHRRLRRLLPPVPVPATTRRAWRPISTALFRLQGPVRRALGEPSARACAILDHRADRSLLFLFLQRYIYNGFTSGATK